MSTDVRTDVRPADATASEAEPAAEHDPEYRVLRGLARLVETAPRPRTPLDSLQWLVDLSRELTCATYGALAVADEHDRTEGFVTSGLTKAQLRGLKVPPQGHGPLGSLRTDGRPVRYDNLDNAPNAFGFPPKHPTMKTMLGVPIWAHGEVRGSIYVTDRNGGEPFTDDDEAVLLVIARYAGAIVERDWY
jgi:GAF domain-containing protein